MSQSLNTASLVMLLSENIASHVMQAVHLGQLQLTNTVNLQTSTDAKCCISPLQKAHEPYRPVIQYRF